MVETAIAAAQLRVMCDPASLPFETTAELDLLPGTVGQDAAVEAIRLSAEIRHRRFNLFVQGAEGTGRHSSTFQILNEVAATRPVPQDWVYLQNFDDPDKPVVVGLSPRQGPRLKTAMAALVEDLARRIPAVLDSEDCQTRRSALEQEFSARHETAFEALAESARKREVLVLRTPTGFSLAPFREGEVIKPEALDDLPEKERRRIERDINTTEQELEDFLASLPELGREQREARATLNAKMAETAVRAAMKKALRGFGKVAALRHYFQALRADLIVNADLFLSWEEGQSNAAFPRGASALREDPDFHRYSVNVLVTHAEGSGAPVVAETLPTLSNLSGQVEYISQQGTLITDFTKIKPGALHRANGGFLLLDARRVLAEPFAWDALKRCLETMAIHFTNAADRLGMIATTTLEPEPIPLDVRVVLIGDPELHQLLSELDPDFGQFFRVSAEFRDEMERDAQSVELFARLLATVGAKEGLRPVARDGVAALVDLAARQTEDQERLSLRSNGVLDVLREADHLARKADAATTTAAHVSAAIAARERRLGLGRGRVQEMIRRGMILISTSGSVIGQVNGLTVADFGELPFGTPVRVTARVRMGSGRVVDIEREVRMGGPIHSKAVLILSGFLAARYATGVPLSLWASLVLEQNYGPVEGDSASLAELCALMSALAEVPVSQSFAVTGSVNQLGDVQPVGGINEKIEGYFDVCKAQGLTGRQAVLIPRANLASLMLRADVIEAVAAEKFHIHAVSHVDEAIPQLTGLPAGTRSLDGEFETGSVNANIEMRLLDFAEARAGLAFGNMAGEGAGG